MYTRNYNRLIRKNFADGKIYLVRINEKLKEY